MSRGLAILFGEANHARLHAGLSLACAAAALGRPVRLFFHAESVAALQHDRHWGGDAGYAVAGLAPVRELAGQAIAMGVRVMACQSGLHLLGLTPANLIDGAEPGGLVAFLVDARDDELLAS